MQNHGGHVQVRWNDMVKGYGLSLEHIDDHMLKNLRRLLGEGMTITDLGSPLATATDHATKDVVVNAFSMVFDQMGQVKMIPPMPLNKEPKLKAAKLQPKRLVSKVEVNCIYWARTKKSGKAWNLRARTYGY